MSSLPTNPSDSRWDGKSRSERPGAAPRSRTEGGGAPMELRLELLSGDRAGEVRTFPGPEVLLGRRPRNHLVFDGPNEKVVSGYHARFELRSDGWWVEDKLSTNGTLVNGRLVEVPVRINSGDIVELGQRTKSEAMTSVRLRVQVLGPVGLHPERAKTSPVGSQSPGAGGVGTIIIGNSPSPAPTGPLTVMRDDVDTRGPIEADPRSTKPGMRPVVVGGSESSKPKVEPIEARSTSSEPKEPAATKAEPPPPAAAVPSRTPPSSVDPTATSPRVEAAPVARPGVSAPGSAKDRLRALRSLGERLGRSSYQLEVLVARTVGACLEGTTGIDLAAVPGGADLVRRVEQRAALQGDLAAVEELISSRSARRDDELRPLDEQTALEERHAERARGEFDQAREEARVQDSRFRKQFEESRAALDSGLEPVVRPAASEGATAMVGMQRAPWHAWGDALEASLAELRRRIPALDELRRASEEADKRAKHFEAQASASSRSLDETRQRAITRRTELVNEIAELESRRSETKTQIERSAADVQALCEALLQAHFELPDSPFLRLNDFRDARTLAVEVDKLRTEIGQLEEQIG